VLLLCDALELPVPVAVADDVPLSVGVRVTDGVIAPLREEVDDDVSDGDAVDDEVVVVVVVASDVCVGDSAAVADTEFDVVAVPDSLAEAVRVGSGLDEAVIDGDGTDVPVEVDVPVAVSLAEFDEVLETDAVDDTEAVLDAVADDVGDCDEATEGSTAVGLHGQTRNSVG